MSGPSRLEVVTAGHRGDVAVARAGLQSSEPATRAAALGALARLGRLDEAALVQALHDDDSAVRRRACEHAPSVGPSDAVDAALAAVLAGPDAALAEVAAWALGERHQCASDSDDEHGGGADAGRAPAAIVAALAAVATGHEDALCREAAVAALGAIGDEAGLPAVLAATGDRATVRRRAVLALAAFDGPDVTAALERARLDRDWQVRQAAEDLLRED